MQIERIPDILAWSEHKRLSSLTEIRTLYSEALAQRLGCILGYQQVWWGEKGAALVQLVQSLPDEAFERLLTAPETSYRLLWFGRHAVEDIAHFLLYAAQAEWARLGYQIGSVERPLWTALGDYCIHPGGSCYVAPNLGGRLVLDFQSPNSRDLSSALSSASEYGEEARYVCEARPPLVERMASIAAAIESVNPDTAQFVARFTNVVMFVRTGGPEGEPFLSRSPERHIGLTVLVNSHQPDVDDAKLAEALVHEAIHSLIDTYETLANLADDPTDRWVCDASLYDGTPRVVSPWTGTRLVVPTYIHACFVWYGIVQFWSEALDGQYFPSARVMERLRAAVRGFLSDSVLEQLRPYQSSLHPKLMAALSRMRSDVASAFDATA